MIYKRSIYKLVTSIIATVIVSGIVYFISSNFIRNTYAIIIGFLFFILMSYFHIFSDNIKFEVDGTKLRYYLNNKLIKEYELKGSIISYDIKQSNYTDRIDLIINDDVIDCASLGLNKFYDLYYDIEELTGIKRKIKVGGKNE